MISLRHTLRALLRTPFVTVVAIISLSFGIGATAAIYSLFHHLLLSPLPVQEPVRLVNLSAPGPKPGSQSSNVAGKTEQVFSYPMFRDLERDQTVFTGIAAHRIFGANLSFGGQTLNGQGMLVSGSYFPVLGLRPELGRLIDPGDDPSPGESHIVVLSHGCWQTRFGSRSDIVNQTMIINGQTFTIVGVAPRGFEGTSLGARPQVFVPVTLRESMSPGAKGTFENRRAYWIYLFARLKPGVSRQQAQAALNLRYHALLNDVEAPLQKGMSEQTMAQFRAKQVLLEDGPRGQSTVSREAKEPLVLLLCVTGLVLLIACANIANLLLARGAARAGEIAIRLSIGAGRRHLVAQLLSEAGILALAGGLAGLVVAQWTLALIASMLPAEAAAVIPMRIDLAVILFAFALTVATGLLFGLFPALHSTRSDLTTVLKGQAGQPSGARSAARFRTALATVQIFLSMTLLIGAGLFTKSLLNISRVNLGLKVDNVITFSVAPVLNGYSAERSRQFFELLDEELPALPGVTGASGALVPLLAGDNWGQDVSVEGYKFGPDTDMNSGYNAIGPGYFQTLGIPLLAGREFTRADTAAAPKVAIVNEAFAKKFNLGRDAVGKRIGPRNGQLDTEIVGLVKDAKYSEVKDEVPPLFYRPYRQDSSLGFLTYYVRTSLDPEQFLSTMPRVIAAHDANLPVVDLRTMPQQVRENVFMDRFITVLSSAFAFLATLLAAVGLYGVLAYTVAQRTREIGLRMALGATPGRVRGMVLRQVGMMTLVGGVIGLVSAAVLARYAQSLLYQIQGWDPVVFAGAAAALALVAAGAGLVPARRASRVDPMRALRCE